MSGNVKTSPKVSNIGKYINCKKRQHAVLFINL